MRPRIFGYYGYISHWGGFDLEGGLPLPGRLASDSPMPPKNELWTGPSKSAESHLRGSAPVFGYHIEAADGEIEHSEGFVVDDEAWAIRYLNVATRKWLPGKKVLISPAWIEQVVGKTLKSASAIRGQSPNPIIYEGE